MPGTVTLTGTAGAGLAVTAVPFTDVREVQIEFNKNLVTLLKNDGTTVSPISVAAATTVTATKVGNLWTLTIS
jgi:hypothetical protein